MDLYEGTLNYVFITGYDRSRSNISVRTAEAAAIFTDGTMDVITVNVKDTNDNIADYNRVTSAGAKIDTQTFYKEWSYGGNDDGDYNNGNPVLNRWYTYTVNESGVYTLKPAIRSFSTAVTEETTIDCSNVRLEGRGAIGDKDSGYENGNVRAYGEDASIFITVEQDDVDTMDNAPITDVTGTYTGVQSVDLEIENTKSIVDGLEDKAQIYTVYDDDNYIIGAIVVGDATGSTANIVYTLGTAKSEELRDGTYYWEFDVVMNGEIQTLTVKSKYDDVIDFIKNDRDGIVELRFDADGYVVKAVDVTDIYTYRDALDDTVDITESDVYSVQNPSSGNLTINLKGRTLYITANQRDMGLAIAKDAKAVVIQDENGKSVKTEFDSVDAAINRLADADKDTASVLDYDGRIVAVLNSNGTAAWVVFINESELTTGSNRPTEDPDTDVKLVSFDGALRKIILKKSDDSTAEDVINAIKIAFTDNGYIWEDVHGSHGSYTATAYPKDAASSNPITFDVEVR